MKTNAFLSIILACFTSTTAYAQDECIENIVGDVVCGAEAEAVRARINAEAAARSGAASSRSAKSASPSFRKGSIYSNYGMSAFVRGGYIFGARGSGIATSSSAPSGAVGLRFGQDSIGNTRVSLETEILYARDSEDLLLVGAPVEATAWGLTALGGYRFDFMSNSSVNPFLSIGIGPAYTRLKIDDGVTTIADGDWTFAYSGRTGLAVRVGGNMQIEGAYRYLGTTQVGAPGQHSAEVGVNFGF